MLRDNQDAKAARGCPLVESHYGKERPCRRKMTRKWVAPALAGSFSSEVPAHPQKNYAVQSYSSMT